MFLRRAAYDPDVLNEYAAPPRRAFLNDIFVDDDGPVSSFAEAPTSGRLAAKLDAATADPAALSDDDLLDVVIGFDRVASWAQARQAVVLAEFARRRPVEPASAGEEMSRFAADE